MNKGDVEFTVSLNTSPAEQQLHSLTDKMKNAGHIYQDVFRDVGQGFKTVGTPYQNSNNYGVPSVQVLERTLALTANTMEKFARIVETISVRMVNFSTVGSPYSSTPRTIYASNNVAGYLPSSTSPNVRNWFPTEHYTHAQVESLNNPSKVFDYLISKRNNENPYTGVYDLFNQIHSPMGAMGMYGIWSNLFGKKGLLSLPAPKNVWAGADGIDTPEEQGKDVVEQDKKDNDELKEKLLLWSKIGATIYAIRKVIQGLAKLWKFGTETVAGTNSNINEEHGFFSIDPEGAMRANSDKTRAMLYAGVRNMGENAPVSKEGLDYASSKMTEMWTAAMSGRNVDARTAIDVQRLKDFFGIDLSVAGLLTGEREGKTATDIQIDMMDKVEKQISKLAEADEITKGQVIDSLKNILGDELVNAIVANANKNLKIDATDLKLTIAERIMKYGGSAIPSGDLTEKTTKAVDAISEFKESLQTLKNTIVSSDGINNAFVNFTKAIKSLTDWMTRKLNVIEGEKNALGEVKDKVSIASLTNEEVSRYRNFKQKENDRNDKYKNKDALVKQYLRSGNPLEILNALYLSQPEVRSAADIENLGIKQQELEVGNAIRSGKLDKNSSNPIIKALANYKYRNPNTGEELEGYDAFIEELATAEYLNWDTEDVKRLFSNTEDMSEHEMLLAMRNFVKLNPTAKKAFSEAFDKGGVFDFGTSMDIIKYLYSTSMLGSPEEQFKAFQVLAKESYKVLDNTVNFEVQHNDRDKNGRIDAGEVVLTVVVKDQYNNETRKTITADLQ